MTDGKKSANAKVWSKIVAKAWADPDFKKRLIADPKAIFAAEGLTLPENKEIKILEDTASAVHLVLPLPPEDEGDLESMEERLAATFVALA